MDETYTDPLPPPPPPSPAMSNVLAVFFFFTEWNDLFGKSGTHEKKRRGFSTDEIVCLTTAKIGTRGRV